MDNSFLIIKICVISVWTNLLLGQFENILLNEFVCLQGFDFVSR